MTLDQFAQHLDDIVQHRMYMSRKDQQKRTRTMNDLADGVAQKLYEDILIGVFPLGGRLVEEPLTKRYGVKRHVLREAFSALEDMDCVVHVPNRGVFVHEPAPREMHELFAMRRLLEVEASRQTRFPVPKSVTEALRAVQAEHSAALVAGDLRGVLRLNSKFHHLQFAACKNQVLCDTIETFAKRTQLVTALKFPDKNLMAQVEAQHLDIVVAMEQGSTEKLIAAVLAHYNLAQVDRYEAMYLARHDEIVEAE